MGGKKGKKKSKKKRVILKPNRWLRSGVAAGKTISSVKAANKSSNAEEGC